MLYFHFSYDFFLSSLVLLHYRRSGSEGVLVDLSDTTPSSTGSVSSPDIDLRLAMELSAQAQEEEERKRKKEEEDLERILQLSLTEKWQSKMVGEQREFLFLP